MQRKEQVIYRRRQKTDRNIPKATLHKSSFAQAAIKHGRHTGLSGELLLSFFAQTGPAGWTRRGRTNKTLTWCHLLSFRAGGAVSVRPAAAAAAAGLSLVQHQSYSSSCNPPHPPPVCSSRLLAFADLSQKLLSVRRAALGEIAASMCQGALRLSLTAAC